MSFLVVYFPPAPGAAKARLVWKKTVSVLVDFIDKWLMELPARTTPIIFTDLNDVFEAPSEQLLMQVVGSHPSHQPQGHIATVMIDVLAKHRDDIPSSGADIRWYSARPQFRHRPCVYGASFIG